MTERIFPIMTEYYCRDRPLVQELRLAGICSVVIGIPWDMIAPHAKQARLNHSQSLEQLAARGGLSASEALAVLEDRECREMGEVQASAGLAAALVEWRERQPPLEHGL